MLALENPHWGISGVPFMKSTTGLDETADSIAVRVSVESDLYCEGVRRMRWDFGSVAARDLEVREDCRSACCVVRVVSREGLAAEEAYG